MKQAMRASSSTARAAPPSARAAPLAISIRAPGSSCWQRCQAQPSSITARLPQQGYNNKRGTLSVARATATASNGSISLQAESTSQAPVFGALRQFGTFLLGGMIIGLFAGVLALWGAPVSPLMEQGSALTSAIQQLGLGSVANFLTKQQALAVAAGIFMFVSTALGPVLTLGDRNVPSSTTTSGTTTGSAPASASKPSSSSTPPSGPTTPGAKSAAATSIPQAAEQEQQQQQQAPSFIRTGGRTRAPVVESTPVVAATAAPVTAAAASVVDTVSRGGRGRTAVGPVATPAVAPAVTPAIASPSDLSGRGGRARGSSPAPSSTPLFATSAAATTSQQQPQQVVPLDVSRGGRTRSPSPAPSSFLLAATDAASMITADMMSPARTFPDGAVLYSQDQFAGSPPARVLAASRSRSTSASPAATSSTDAADALSRGGRGGRSNVLSATVTAPAEQQQEAEAGQGVRPSGGVASRSASGSPGPLKEPVVAVAAVAWAAMDATRDLVRFATTEAAPALQKLASAGANNTNSNTSNNVPVPAMSGARA